MMRLFFGVPVDDAAAAQLGMACAALQGQRGWRWLPASNWHVTVAFLGNLDDALLPALTALGERVAQMAGRCTLRFRGLEWWPQGKRPRLLAAVAPEAGALLPLRDRLAEGLDQLAVPFDHRPLHPHITLLRLQRGEPVDAEQLRALVLPALDVELPVSELLLYRSEASPTGRRYTPIWRRELRA